MKIAVPVDNGHLAGQFDQTPAFMIFDIDPVTRSILNREEMVPSANQPQLVTLWLAGRGVRRVLAGEIGMCSRNLLAIYGIGVNAGVTISDPESLVMAFMEGRIGNGPGQSPYREAEYESRVNCVCQS